MGSRLREHVRKPGSIEVENRHLWLPESHRLVQRSAALGPLSAAQYRAWVESLDPKATPAGRRIEPDRRNWGLKGVACLLKAGRECVSSAKVYWDMIASLERAGYRAGTNLYGVPFDWRFDPTENHLCADLARVLHHITNTTRWNKAYVVAHSLGNVQVLYCIQRVFGLETNSKIKALVSIAAPWTGAPKALRVLFSGDEMVSQYIIHDADTRDFSRAMSATYMLLPDERVFGNHTVLSLVGGDSTLGMSSMHGASSGSARFDKLTIDSEHYRARRGELRSLFSKVEAHVPQTAARMRAMYDRSLRLVDVWTAPPVPVVCVIGSGKPTMVGYLYREPWPKNMDEEPCPLGYEDGDVTVPVRSAETICRHWQQQKRCHSPLVTAQPTMYRGKNDECVDINYMHCRSANMESADTPRGGDHCTELHSRILHKNSLIDLVQSIAFNPRAFEPGHGVSLERVDEFVQVLAWLYNSAAQRLPQDAAFVAALAAAGFHAQSPSDAGASTRADEGAGADADTDADATLAALTSSLATLRARSTYEDILRALQRLTVAVRERVQHAISEASGSTERSSEAGGEDDARVADAGQRDGGGDAINVGGDAIASAVAAAVLGVGDAMAPLLQASNAMGAALDGVSKARGRAANGRRASGAPSPSATADTAEAPPSTCAVGGATADAAVGMLGLPDCVDAYEAASFSSYRSATLDDEELRRSAADAKKRMRALRDAITHLEPPLHEMRSQVAWCEHHWNALTRLLGEPEPRPQDLELSKPDYESSLYGKMQGDDLLAS